MFGSIRYVRRIGKHVDAWYSGRAIVTVIVQKHVFAGTEYHISRRGCADSIYLWRQPLQHEH